MTPSKDPYRAVLLDFDGTYADTAPDMIGALNVLRERADREPLDYSVARPYVSHGSRALVNLGFADLTADQQRALIPEFLDVYARGVARHTRAFDGIDDWIAKLEANDIRWGIVTNKPEYLTRAIIEQMPMPHAPHCVVAGDSLIKRKPHPMPALHAAALLRVPANACVFVGDSINDVTAGRTAGMYTVAAAYGYLLPDDDPHAWHAHAVVDSVEALSDHTRPLLRVD